MNVRSIWRLHPLGSCVLDYLRAVYLVGALFGDHLHDDASLLND